MTVLDHGSYQGTQVFILPRDTYQPNVAEYVYTYVEYGSCSVCDTLQGISGYEDELPCEEQIVDYMILALHLLQRANFLKEERI